MPYRVVHTELEAYLKDISRYKLLTADQEHKLALEIRRKYAAYRSALGPRGERARLPKKALKALEAYTQVRDLMVEANLRLVVSIAKRYSNRGLTLLDLIEEGNIGLLKAVERFNPRMGTRFSTYATYWIRQSVRRALINTGQTVRIPAYMVEMIAKWKHAALELAGELGREPSFDEIAEVLDLAPDKVVLIRRAVRSVTQTGAGGLDGAGTAGALVSDEGAEKPEDHLLDSVEQEKISQLLGVIDAREAQILRMRFGLDHQAPKTLSEIGKKMRITRERVRQLESRTLRKLQRILTEGERQKPPPAPVRG